MQLVVGVVLAALASSLNVKLLVTTHSDLIIFPLIYIKLYSPGPQRLAEMVKEAVGRMPRPESVENIARAAAEANKLDLRVYLVKDGKIHEVPVNRFLSELPSLGEATSIAFKAVLEAG